jgi:predicted transcriptional regulator
MNNYDLIFSIVKKHCKVRGAHNRNCFEQITSEIEFSTDLKHVDFYLDSLHNMGLINYAEGTKTIFLTDKGKRTEQVANYN